MNFKNLTVELHVFYIRNTHVKFPLNQILFTIQSINSFLYVILNNNKNLKFKHFIFINDIDIDL